MRLSQEDIAILCYALDREIDHRIQKRWDSSWKPLKELQVRLANKLGEHVVGEEWSMDRILDRLMEAKH